MSRQGRVGGEALALAGALMLAVAGASSPVHAGVNVWTPLGPDGGSVGALAVSPAQPSLVYAGSGPPVTAELGAGLGLARGGFFRSEDGGATWVRASRGIDPLVMAVVADPQTATTVYEISFTSTMKSVDAGATWSPVVLEPSGTNLILSLAIDPRSPSTLYAGASFGIWKSTDGGRSWTALDFTGGQVTTIAVDSSPSATAVYAFASNPGMLVRSIDAGKTWSEADNGLPIFTESLPNAQQLVADPSTTPATLYFSFLDSSNVGHFQRSTDMAQSWTSPLGPCSYPVAVGAGVVYAGPAVSTDHGATWTAATAALGNAQALAAAPGAVATVYAGTSQGLWKSVDAAATWQPAIHGLAATPTAALAVDPLHPRILYAAVQVDPLQGPYLLRSGNSGQTWRPIGPPFLSNDLQNLVIDPVTPTTLYAGSFFGSLAKSVDSGNTWEPLTPLCNGVAQLAIDPLHPDTLYAAGPFGCKASKSVDGGHTWSPLALPGQVTRIGVAPATPATLYALTFSSGVFKSTDAGVTWRRLRSPRVAPVGLAIDPTDANRVFMTATSGIFGTTDGGKTWIELDHRLPLAQFSFFPPTVIAIDPHTPSTVYTGGFWGIYRSTNGGKIWHPIVGGLPEFAVDPSLSPFGGLLVLDPQQPGKLYAGTLSNGVYTYTVQ